MLLHIIKTSFGCKVSRAKKLRENWNNCGEIYDDSCGGAWVAQMQAFQNFDGLSQHASLALVISRWCFQATNLLLFSSKEIRDVFKQWKLLLNLAPNGVDVMIVVSSLLSSQCLFQIAEEICEMLGLLVEPQVQFNDWDSRWNEATQVAQVLRQQLNLVVHVVALGVF